MNTITDLKMILHQHLERLDNPDMTLDELQLEIPRTKAIVSVSEQIVSVNALALRALALEGDGRIDRDAVSNLLGEY